MNFSKNASYFDQPIALTQQLVEEEKGKADAIKFACWAKAFNQQFQNKKPEERG